MTRLDGLSPGCHRCLDRQAASRTLVFQPRRRRGSNEYRAYRGRWRRDRAECDGCDQPKVLSDNGEMRSHSSLGVGAQSSRGCARNGVRGPCRRYAEIERRRVVRAPHGLPHRRAAPNRRRTGHQRLATKLTPVSSRSASTPVMRREVRLSLERAHRRQEFGNLAICAPARNVEPDAPDRGGDLLAGNLTHCERGMMWSPSKRSRCRSEASAAMASSKVRGRATSPAVRAPSTPILWQT